jgi:hypothetical protein
VSISGYSQFQRGQAGAIARELDERAQRMWNAVQGDLDVRNPLGVRGPQGMQLYMAVSNFANSARLYQDLANRYRNDNILRGGARSLVAQARDIDRLMDRTGALDNLRDDWSRAQQLVANLSDVYNLNYNAGRELSRYDDRPYEYGDNRYRTGSGQFRWQGQVDGSDYIRLQGSRVNIQHLEANPIQNDRFSLPEPLPRADLDVNLMRLQGRGRVELVQQPSAANNYTAVVLIDDPEEGSDFYEFQLTW